MVKAKDIKFKAAVQKVKAANKFLASLNAQQILQHQANQAALKEEDIENGNITNANAPQSSSNLIANSKGKYLRPEEILLNRLKKIARRFPNNTFSYEFFDDEKVENNLKPSWLPVEATHIKQIDIAIPLEKTYNNLSKDVELSYDESNENINDPHLIFSDGNELFHADLDPKLPSTRILLTKLLMQYHLDYLIFKQEEHSKHTEHGLSSADETSKHAKIKQRTMNRKMILSAYYELFEGEMESDALEAEIIKILGIEKNHKEIRESVNSFNRKAVTIKNSSCDDLLTQLDSILKSENINFGWSHLEKFEKQLNYRKTMIAIFVVLFFVEFGIFNSAPDVPFIEDNISPQTSNILQMMLSTAAVFLHIYKWHNKIQTHSYHTYQNEVTTKESKAIHGCLIIGDEEKKGLDVIYKEGKVVAAQTALLGIVMSVLLGIEPMNNGDIHLKMQLPIGLAIAAVTGILNGYMSHYAHKDERPVTHHYKIGALSAFATAAALVLIYPVRKMSEDHTFNFGERLGGDFSLDPQLTVLRGLCLLFAAALCFANRNEMHAIKSVDATYKERNSTKNNP